MTWPTKTDFVDGDVLTAAQVNNIGTNLNLADPTGITDGYVLTADGANGMGWEAIVAGGMTLITSGTLSGSSVNLTSIPATYKDLYLYLTNINTNVAATTQFRFNNNSTSNIYQQTYVKQGTTPTQQYGGINNFLWTTPNGSGNTSASLFIPQYSRSIRHIYFIFNRFDIAATPTHTSEFGSGSMNTDISINQINLICNGSTWTSGNYYLYGAS